MTKANHATGRRRMSKRAVILPVLLAALAGNSLCSSALAKKPPKGGSSDTLPPVTIVVDEERFEYRPELGGVYDKQEGVIWGYSLMQMTNGVAGYDYATTQLAPNYAARLMACGDQKYDAGFLEDAADFYDAATAAALYNNWRLPTLTEARSATAAGMFTYGLDGLNLWTGSPTDVLPGLPYGGVSTWTSDTAKLKGTPSAWLFNPADGGARLVSRTSGIDAIVVRTYTGP